MKIIMLRKNPVLYSCNAYLVLGTWNRLEDVNTLVDIGQDGYIINQIKEISTGLGKRPVELVVFTHNHFDHAGGLGAIKNKYDPLIYAYMKFDGIDYSLSDGQVIRMGDCYFEVIHIQGHSSDSLLFYCKKERIIFAGDTSLNIRSEDASYTDDFISVLDRLSKLKIEAIYSGHDAPVMKGADEIISRTYGNIKRKGITGQREEFI